MPGLLDTLPPPSRSVLESLPPPKPAHPGFVDSFVDTIKSAPASLWHALTSTDFGEFKDAVNKITPEEWAQAKQHQQERQAGKQPPKPSAADLAQLASEAPTVPEA